jgi:hypothetical protein
MLGSKRRKAAQRQAALQTLEALLSRIEDRDPEACKKFDIGYDPYRRAKAVASTYDPKLHKRIELARVIAMDVCRYGVFLSGAKRDLEMVRNCGVSLRNRILSAGSVLGAWDRLSTANQERAAVALDCSRNNVVAELDQLLTAYHDQLMADRQLDLAQQLRDDTGSLAEFGRLGAARLPEPEDWLEVVQQYIYSPTLHNLGRDMDVSLAVAAMDATRALEARDLTGVLVALARCGDSTLIRQHLGGPLFYELSKLERELRPWCSSTGQDAETGNASPGIPI